GGGADESGDAQQKKGRGGAEAEAQGEDGGRGEPWRVSEGAGGVADVVPERLESLSHSESFLPGIARSMKLPDRVVPRGGEAPAGFDHRVGSAPAGRKELLGAHLHVEADPGPPARAGPRARAG